MRPAITGCAAWTACSARRITGASALGSAIRATKDRVHGYVLGDFAKADQPWLAPLLDAVADAAPALAADQPEAFMTKVALATQEI